METTLTKYDRYRLKDVEGYREKKREFAKTPEQRAKRTEYMKKWREANRAKHNAQAKESYHRHRDERLKANKNRHYLSKYGVTKEHRDQMIIDQRSLCKICGEERPLHMDHDHKTGKFRGLICCRCNTHLGWYEKVGKEPIESYLNV